MAVAVPAPQPTTPIVPLGLDLDPGTSFEAWRALGPALAVRGDDAGAWAIGDWVVFGRARFGRFYRQAAITTTRADPAALCALQDVARRFAPARRRRELTFGHHAEVCVIASDRAQDAWLERAAAARWSREDLRARVASAFAPAPPALAESFRVTVDPGRAERWHAAAARSRCGVDEWIARALDRAARGPAFGH
jgi:hypothetical protein